MGVDTSRTVRGACYARPMVSQPHAPARKGYPYSVTRNGLTYVFETEEEMSAFLAGPRRLSREEVEELFAELDRINAAVLERTGGKGISEEDMQDALAAMRDH